MKLLKWIFYWMLTLPERHLYSIGKTKGKNCTGFDDNIFGRRYHYENKPPVRNFLTYNEFMRELKK